MLCCVEMRFSALQEASFALFDSLLTSQKSDSVGENQFASILRALA